MSKASKTIARGFMSMLLAAMSVQAAYATAGSAKPLEGTWCSEDTAAGATIVQYSAAGSEITAFTVLSEQDPRRIGRQASMQVTAEAPNVFVRRAFGGADEEFSVHSDKLTVNSLWIWNRGTNDEMRHVLATQTYYKCDVGQALRRAQAFMASPNAEQATRMAIERDQVAELEGRRNATKDAYYAGVIRQLGQARLRP